MERVWQQPCGSPCNGGTPAAQLMLYNSLVDRKVPFVPAAGPNSKQISWYTCGERRLPPPPPACCRSLALPPNPASL